MESLPLIAKSNIIPNLDVTHLIREIFQTEFESYVPSKKLSENLRKSLEYERIREDSEGQKTFRSVYFLENLSNENTKLMKYAENVLQAYGDHEEALDKIAKVELNIMEAQAVYLHREKMIGESGLLRDLLRLKRHPLMKAYRAEYVKQYRLLQGESGLPQRHEADSDYRLKDFSKWKKRLSSFSKDSLAMKFLNKSCEPEVSLKKVSVRAEPERKKSVIRPKKSKTKEEQAKLEIFRADPSAVCFTEFTPGEVYECRITVQNVHTKPMKFSLKSLSRYSPFKVEVYGTETSRILPGLCFKLLVTFEPRSLDDENESVVLMIEDGSRLMIPLSSYLEPPLLKTNEDIDELTKNISEKIRSSYIDCGSCLPGDSKVTKIRFYSYGGTGEFFIMSLENWTNWHINCLTSDNFTDIPPFRLYPSYFKLDKNQVVDLYVEFKPPVCGMHSDSIVVVCSNGETRFLDILGDGISWHRSFIAFEDSLEKDFPPYINDDHRALYHANMGSLLSTGRAEKAFSVTNKSKMPFEFRWEMRDAVVPFKGQEEPKKISQTEVKVEPSAGILDPYSTRRFLVTVSFQKKRVGHYRTVLSLYVIGLPYPSIEQATTIIRPSVLRGRFKSGSIYGEEDNLLISPEYSHQSTYESVQEGMRTTESKYQQQFPMTVCRKHPSICAIPLKRSKTYSNIGEGVEACTCTASEQTEPLRHDYDYPQRKPNITELGSDLLWDFVDVLVDEVELWAEVQPTVVVLEPYIINLYENVRIHQPPVQCHVYVFNSNNVPIVCKWLKDRPRSSTHDGLEAHTGKARRDEEPGEEGDGSQSTGSLISSTATVDNYKITCCTEQRCGVGPDGSCHEESADKHCDVTVEPREDFVVPAGTRVQCTVSVSATHPGLINRVLWLRVEDGDHHVHLHVTGKVPDRKITVTPQVLDFGPRKRGARYTKHFKIRNESEDSVEWRVEQYRYDYGTQMLELVDDERQGCLQNVKGTIEGRGCTIESYRLDARKPGLQMFVLKFDLSGAAYATTHSRYMLVLAEVQTPKLAIEAPKFQNAILAPSRTMYVGQMITQTVVLRNMKNVSTTFIWGYPFGCHCRKLKLDMRPKFCVVGGMKKLAVRVNITPLEEKRYVGSVESPLDRQKGIVEHCYIPCFYSRNVNPALLSIVGVIKNLQVTFEIAKESIKICNSTDGTGSSTLKISWPIKNFDPFIGISNVLGSDILDFVCHCNEVDAEYLKSTTPVAVDAEVKATDEEYIDPMMYAYEDGEGREEEEEEEGEDEEEQVKNPCERKYYTPERMLELRRALLERRGETENNEEEDAVEEGFSDIQAEGMVKDPESNAIVEYPKRECVDVFYYVASEIQFLNVLYKTVTVKHFMIKNESPITTSFRLRVQFFGPNHRAPTDRLQAIKKRVFGKEKEDFKEDLMCGQPLLITTVPAEGTLDGWSSTKVSVFVFGDTWGEYRDFIVCDVCGLPPFVMKVFVLVSGHPILFPMFNTSHLDIPVLRFDAIKFGGSPVVRNIRVRNTSSIPVTVTWMVFLTTPLSDDEKEDPFNLCLDLYTDKESEDQEKATKSSHNYLSKNTSGSVPIFDVMDMDKPSSRFTGMDPASEMDSEKKDSPLQNRCSESEASPMTVADSTKPEVQLLENFGKMDLHVFQINPRELNLEPYSEEKLAVSFDPNYYEQDFQVQDFEAVATGCVRLRQEYAHYPDIYHRPCGRDYVSKLLIMRATVERPRLRFDIFRNDLRFVVNANDVLKAKADGYKVKRKYTVRNKCGTEVTTRIRIEPGEMISVNQVETYRKVYRKYDSEHHQVTVDPETSMKVHLELTLSYNQILEIHKKLSFEEPNRMKATRAESSELISEGNVMSDRSDVLGEAVKDAEREETAYYDLGDSSSYSSSDSTSTQFGIRPLDSFLMIGDKARQWNSASKTEGNVVYSFRRRVTDDPKKEYFGESPELTPGAVAPQKDSGCSYVIKEDVVFEQVGLLKQVITPELHIFFPSVMVNPEVVDFGNVYIGETCRRYASVINRTQFPTQITVTWTVGGDEFAVRPSVAHLPAANYKSDTGIELTLEFKPKEPGYFKKGFRIFGNREMEFDFTVLTVVGYGTWNERYKYLKTEHRLPPVNVEFKK